MKVEPAKPHVRHVTPLFVPADDLASEAPASQSVESATTNAAVLYRQAFALYNALSKEEQWLAGDWRTNVDASVESELCEKIRPICELMHQATAVTNCDWGLERPITTTTVNTLRPDLTASRGVARAAIWSAAHCHADDRAKVVDDLVSTSQLGHRLPPDLISYLVGLAIQGMALDFTAKHASTLSGEGDTRLIQVFDDNQFGEQLSRALEHEADLMDSHADRPPPPPSEEAKRAWAEMFQEQFPQEQFPELDQADYRQAKEWLLKYAKALQLPEPEYREWLTRLHAAGETNPSIKYLVLPVEGAVDRTSRAAVTSAMVVAGLAVVQSGADALQSHPDPASGQPFVYTETADGFELQSSHQYYGKPMKMQFK